MVKLRKRRKLIAVLVLFALLFSLALPAAASAGFLKKLIRFIVSVPEKLTRPLGPLGPLAPFAQVWLLGKVPKFGNIWHKASRIKNLTDDIETRKKNLAELKNVYREQAKTLRLRAKKHPGAKGSHQIYFDGLRRRRPTRIYG